MNKKADTGAKFQVILLGLAFCSINIAASTALKFVYLFIHYSLNTLFFIL
jgi:hypothetical protein